MTATSDLRFDLAIVGAGFSGLYMLHRARKLGLSVRVFEQGPDIGGTWYWNGYPGARCDVESMQYSYSFDEELQQAWTWSERFAGQPEILRYINHVADRFDLRRDVELNCTVEAASYDEGADRWTLRLADGRRIDAPFVVMATGCLSTSRLPDFPGRDSFDGPTYHTGNWPREGVDFAGLNVGLIGTGSSAIQAIPEIAKQAKTLTVFQRTPNYSIPARNAPMTPDYEASWKGDYQAKRRLAREETRSGTIYDFPERAAFEVEHADREKEYEARWLTGGANFMYAFNDLIRDADANETAAEFVRRKIKATVRDPKVAEILSARDYPIGTKRICLDTDYFETFNRDNVSLVDIRSAPIEAITPQGIRTGGRDHTFDAIVFATGFDAMTGALGRVDICGRGGLALKDKWVAGPRAYLGLMSAGFPNFFMVTGPGSPSVLSNVLVSIEQHIEWITDCLADLRGRGVATIEPSLAAEDDWVAHVNEVAHTTLYPRAASWYMGANIPGKPRVFMPYIGGVGAYRKLCAEIARDGYRGFVLTKQDVRDAAVA